MGAIYLTNKSKHSQGCLARWLLATDETSQLTHIKTQSTHIMDKQRKVYAIYDTNGGFFQYIKASELNGATRHFLKLNKGVTIKESYISNDQFKALFS